MFLPAVALCACALAAPDPIQLFNGQDFTHWYTWIQDRGRDTDPKNVFTVVDGVIRISGEEWGCITTSDEYENYVLTVEFKWGDKTWGKREHAARDSGILVHSTGEDGGYSGIWMCGLEVQMIEGGTGDLLAVGDKTDAYQLTCPVIEDEPHIYQPDGKLVTINGGRIDWWGRDPGWKDVKDFRGERDVEKPVGEWNVLKTVADGETLTVYLNGVEVNRAVKAKPAKGRIQIQSEGAEVFVRKIELTPLPTE